MFLPKPSPALHRTERHRRATTGLGLPAHVVWSSGWVHTDVDVIDDLGEMPAELAELLTGADRRASPRPDVQAATVSAPDSTTPAGTAIPAGVSTFDRSGSQWLPQA